MKNPYPENKKPGKEFEKTLESTFSADLFSPEGTIEGLDKSLSYSETTSSLLEETQSALLKYSGRGDESLPDIDEPTLDVKLKKAFAKGETVAAGERRFTEYELIGEGTNARVFSVKDENFDRYVAFKVIKQSGGSSKHKIQKFIHEARVTASLEHPNILPVYDINIAESGDCYISMKRVEGLTLGNAIRRTQKGQVPKEISTLNDMVSIIISLCNALAYSHSRGIIHQDIKPDNVMIGKFGEVLVVDWGTSVDVKDSQEENRRRLVGTPAYMSPEQARTETVDNRSDIYAVGATFFHMIFLRHPLWAKDMGVFWERKRKGEIEPPTPEEAGKIPKQLLAIILKSLSAEVESRYQNIEDLAEDLKNYQAGLAVSAYKDTLWDKLKRWYGKNAKILWVSVAFTAAILYFAGLIYGERLKEFFTWHLVYENDFSNEGGSLENDWETVQYVWDNTKVPIPNKPNTIWQVKGGALHGRDTTGIIQNINFKRPVSDNIRVEWDRTVIKGAHNLNMYIGGDNRYNAYTLHVGGFGNPLYLALTKGENFELLDFVILDKKQDIGETYHYRVDKDKGYIRFYINGQRVINYLDYDYYSGSGHQQFGFEVMASAHHTIDNLKVFTKALPERISPLAVADKVFEMGNYIKAYNEYYTLRLAYQGTDIAETALFKMGICKLKMADSVETIKGLRHLLMFEGRYPKSSFMPYSLYERAKIFKGNGERFKAEVIFTRLAENYKGHAILRNIMYTITTELNKQLSSVEDTPEARLPYITEGRKTIHHWGRVLGISIRDNSYLMNSIISLKRWGRYEEVLKNYSEQSQVCAELLIQLQRYPEVLSHYPGDRSLVAQALFNMGRYEEIAASYKDDIDWYSRALAGMGRFEDVKTNPELDILFLRQQQDFEAILEKYPDNIYLVRDALIFLGRFEYLEEKFKNFPHFIALAYITNGHIQAARSFFTNSYTETYDALILLQEGKAGEIPALYPHDQFQQVEAYTQTGEFEKILSSFKINHGAMAQAFLAVGQPEEVIKNYAHIFSLYLEAMRSTGRGAELLNQFPYLESVKIDELMDNGEFERVVADYGYQKAYSGLALLKLGRYQDVLKNNRQNRYYCVSALLCMGQWREALKKYPGYITGAELSKAMGLLEHSINNKPGPFAWEINTRHNMFTDSKLIFPVHIMPPFLKALRGEAASLRAAYQDVLDSLQFVYSQSLWHDAAYISGLLSREDFEAQPLRNKVNARFMLAHAMRLDYMGQALEAVKYYREFQNLKFYQTGYDAVRDSFIKWRIKVLSKAVADKG